MYDIASRHAIRVAAGAARVYQVARHADLSGPWLARLLLGVRIGPVRWLAGARGRAARAASPDRLLLVGGIPFTLIAESPEEEFVLGIMGRFWTLTGGLVGASAAQLRQPPPAGLAQGFWNFRVEPCEVGTRLSTETRVRCGDAVARRQFVRYWRVIGLGSGLIRRSVLRHIRRQAERRAA